jgi:hypothetical protein
LHILYSAVSPKSKSVPFLLRIAEVSNSILNMTSFTKSAITFLLVYIAGIIGRSIVAKEREQKPFSAGLKDKSNHAVAAIVALVAAATTSL